MERPVKRQKQVHPYPPYYEKNGDITQEYNSNSALIVQINNCVSRKVHKYSLCWYISQEFPYGDPYIHRKSGPYPNLASIELRPALGSVKIVPPPKGSTGPVIACCFSQYRMGNTSSSYYLNCKKVDEDYRRKSCTEDSYQHRLHYFNNCLDILLHRLKHMSEIKIIAFPKFIGCGMGGGKWVDYKEIITQFCFSLRHVRPDVSVHIILKIK